MCRLKRSDVFGIIPAGDVYPLTKENLFGDYTGFFKKIKVHQKELTLEEANLLNNQKAVAIERIVADPRLAEVVYYSRPLYNKDNIETAKLIYSVQADSQCDNFKESNGQRICDYCYYLAYRIE